MSADMALDLAKKYCFTIFGDFKARGFSARFTDLNNINIARFELFSGIPKKP